MHSFTTTDLGLGTKLKWVSWMMGPSKVYSSQCYGHPLRAPGSSMPGAGHERRDPACLRNLRFDVHLHGCAKVAAGKHGVLIERFQRVSN